MNHTVLVTQDFLNPTWTGYSILAATGDEVLDGRAEKMIAYRAHMFCQALGYQVALPVDLSNDVKDRLVLVDSTNYFADFQKQGIVVVKEPYANSCDETFEPLRAIQRRFGCGNKGSAEPQYFELITCGNYVAPSPTPSTTPAQN
jgi:hypothetical protein